MERMLDMNRFKAIMEPITIFTSQTMMLRLCLNQLVGLLERKYT